MNMRAGFRVHEQAFGTCLQRQGPWDLVIGAIVLCSDGKTRTVKRIAQDADTFFSIPCAVEVRKNGRRYTVTGYLTSDTVRMGMLDTYGQETYIFRPYTYCKNGDVLPKWERRYQ